MLSVDINLNNLGEYLQGIDYASGGLGYIVDHNGFLIATSTGNDADSLSVEDGENFRYRAEEPPNARIARSAAALDIRDSTDSGNAGSSDTRLTIDERMYNVRTTWIDLGNHTHWLSVVLLDETAVLAPINAKYSVLVVLLFLLALGMLVGSGLHLNRTLSRPLQILSKAAETFPDNRDVELVLPGNRVREIGNLVSSFTEMKVIITRNMMRLESEIREKERKELQLKQAIEEKDVLMKELHHRTKNNLNIIAAMLNLESGRLSDEPSIQLIKRVIGKIYSIALVHRMLYSSNNLMKIDFSRYLRALVELITEDVGGYSIHLDFKIDLDLEIPIDTAVPCGIAINEILSNSIRHGLSCSAEPEVFVEARVIEDNRVHIRIGDNGMGLAGEELTDSLGDNSLGITTIKALIEQQLQGTAEITIDDGFIWDIVFPLDSYEGL